MKLGLARAALVQRRFAAAESAVSCPLAPCATTSASTPA